MHPQRLICVSARAGGDRRPPVPRPAVVAVVLGVLLAAAKGAYVRSHDPEALQTLVLQAGFVVGAVIIGVVAGRRSVLLTAGLRTRRGWQRAAPPAVLAVVGGLAAAVALSDAGASEAVRIVLATALGEEILFRGVVYGLAAPRAGERRSLCRA